MPIYTQRPAQRKIKAHGFTLIELLAIVIILGCLSTASMVATYDLRSAALDANARSIATTIQRRSHDNYLLSTMRKTGNRYNPANCISGGYLAPIARANYGDTDWLTAQLQGHYGAITLNYGPGRFERLWVGPDVPVANGETRQCWMQVERTGTVISFGLTGCPNGHFDNCGN